MGSELKCRVRVGARASDGTALLETDEIVFRGDFRLRIPLRTLKKVVADGDVLIVEPAEGPVARFEIGRAASRWAEKITSPPSRLDKLGVKADTDVTLIGDFDFDDDFVREIGKRAKPSAAITMFAAKVAKDLSRVATLRKKLADDGALWIIYPKGVQEIREADVLGAGREAGLKDVKVARFSETHTALKFVIPVAERKR